MKSKPLFMPYLKLLATLILTLCACQLLAQDNKSLAGEAGSSTSSTVANGSNLSSFSFSGEFLPVEQAYQLDVVVEPGQLIFNWVIQPGYYLYRERFKFAALTPELELGEPIFTPGIRKWDDIFEKEVESYYHSTSVRLPVRSDKSTAVFRIESQGCADAGLCYPPRTQWLEVNLNQGTVSISDKSPAKDSTAITQENVTDPSLLPILLAAILGGIILNLMPCVFPVLSIKALSFTRAHHSTHGKHLHGMAYTTGVIAAFLAIAGAMLFLRSAGEAIGWGFQLQSPLLVSFLIYLFFIMALAFSGLLELGTSIMSLGENRAQGDTLSGSFLTGVLATTVASPCTAPFMGTAIGFTTTQPAHISLLVFAFLGLGMALPFILLAWVPGLTERLPKPGPWMETFKQFLAFPLYLAAVWLLWVVGRQTSMNVAAALVVGAILLAMSVWLWKLRTDRSVSPSKILAGLALLAALLLPQAAIKQDASEPLWKDYSPQLLSTLRTEKRPAFVNLTADWCITCLINEQNALSSPTFHQALIDNDITYIKGDWTRSDKNITELLNSYQRNGVPLYLLYPKGDGEAEVLPQILSESIVLEAIQRSVSK